MTGGCVDLRFGEGMRFGVVRVQGTHSSSAKGSVCFVGSLGYPQRSTLLVRCLVSVFRQSELRLHS